MSLKKSQEIEHGNLNENTAFSPLHTGLTLFIS